MAVPSYRRDKTGTALVVLVAYYVPLTALSLCQVDVPGMAMAVLYGAPTVIGAISAAVWFGLPYPVATPALVRVAVRS